MWTFSGASYVGGKICIETVLLTEKKYENLQSMKFLCTLSDLELFKLS